MAQFNLSLTAPLRFDKGLNAANLSNNSIRVYVRLPTGKVSLRSMS